MISKCYTTVGLSDTVLDVTKIRQAPAVHTLRCRTSQRGGFALGEDMEKRCTKCGKVKPFVDFSICSRNKDGRYSWCRSCDSKVGRKYYLSNTKECIQRCKKWTEDNPEKVKKTKAEWRKKNPERVREYLMRWRRENPEKYAEYCRLWREEHLEESKENIKKWAQLNPEAIKASQLKWRENNPDKQRELNRKGGRIRRALKKSVKESFSTEDEKFVLLYWDNKCTVCGVVKKSTSLAIDHWLPLSKGHALSLSNAVLMCQPCNSKKGAKYPSEVYTEDFVNKVEKKLKGVFSV